MILITLFVTDEMLPKVQTKDDTFTLGQDLQNLHETFDKGRVVLLKNILFSIKEEEHDSLLDHLLRIIDIRDLLKAIDRKMKEEDLVIITLKSLLSIFFY